MKKSLLFLYSAFSILHSAFSQKEANKWLFGNNGGLDFNSGAPLPFPGGQTFTSEGSASVSDAAGNLLFYTDGITVWNKNHLQMPNGFGLLGGFSSSQSALIVLLPGSTTQYYVFTVGQTFTDFNYSIVDMTLQAGNGDVTVKNTLVSTAVCEKLCSVKKPNGLDFWIIVHDAFTDEFDAYSLTSAGLNMVPVVSFAGTPNSGDIGYMKASPDGTKLSTALWNSGNLFELFDFDKATGIVSNALTLPFHTAGSGAYGVEFSPNNRYLYCAWITPGDVRQYDVQAGSPAAIIASEVFLGTTAIAFNGALQLGPDKKIYLAQYGATYLGVINNPDVGGLGCNFVDVGPSIAGISQLGLPNYPSDLFNNGPPVAIFTAPNHICPGTCTDFTNLSLNATSYLWTFSGASPSTSVDANPTNICYNTPGTYSVSLIANNALGSDTLVLNNFITVYPYPPPQGIAQTGDTLTANQGAVSYQWYLNGNLIPGATNYFYVASQSGNYNVVATDVNGCEVEAVIFDVVAQIQSEVYNGQLVIFPNPVTEELEIRNLKLENKTAVEISVYNTIGQKVWVNCGGPDSYREWTVDCRHLPKGMYWLELKSGEKIFWAKFVKQ